MASKLDKYLEEAIDLGRTSSFPVFMHRSEVEQAQSRSKSKKGDFAGRIYFVTASVLDWLSRGELNEPNDYVVLFRGDATEERLTDKNSRAVGFRGDFDDAKERAHLVGAFARVFGLHFAKVTESVHL